MAIKDFLIEYNTYGDIKEANWQGMPVGRGFRVPYSWATLVQKYMEGKKLQSYFGFA